ncbi:WecB/TagA/CpsF family glycosyltransferase [Carnobacterium maltaromaticum]|uniref:WecB/TagA/CpsF family glycosyltransferase n=1 Tax=Carnobacterium maltaromaticum TaxID=2751 RepID=UPI0012F733F3|nr:WecB/TagA/CpsF family glycosyltransferase [Carnobacterium maltaromaticum]
MDTKRIQLLGSQLDSLTMNETLEVIDTLIKNRIPIQHVVINASKINLMGKNEWLKTIINDCPLINADGQSIVWAGRFLGYKIPERVAGIDLFDKLVEKAAGDGLRVYYFGGEETVVRKVIQVHQELYPQLKIAGFRNGYFKESESSVIAQEISASKADILFVAFSSPKKEFWIHKYKEQMNIPFSMGVGGSFDVIAGKTKRAPRWMQKLGLEWFYRFIQEPRRMFKRYIIGNILFLKLVAVDKLRGGRTE